MAFASKIVLTPALQLVLEVVLFVIAIFCLIYSAYYLVFA